MAIHLLHLVRPKPSIHGEIGWGCILQGSYMQGQISSKWMKIDYWTNTSNKSVETQPKYAR